MTSRRKPRDAALDCAVGAGGAGPARLRFPIELPMTLRYDTDTGALAIETPVVRAGDAPLNVMLRLELTAQATHFLGVALQILDAEASFAQKWSMKGLVIQ